MFIKKVKRKCNVRNCKNIDCYAISKTRESGNSVIICRDCLEQALKAIDGSICDEAASKNSTVNIPPLFFNEAADEESDGGKAYEIMQTAADEEEGTVDNSEIIKQSNEKAASRRSRRVKK